VRPNGETPKQSPSRVQVSTDYPIHVDWLPSEWHRRPGRLGMTHAPGTRFWGENHEFERDLETDLAVLRATHRVDVLMNLVDDSDEEAHRLEALMIAPLAHGIQVVRWKIADGGIPDLELGRAIVGDLRRLLNAGKTVVVHCLAGMGRTGTMVACALVDAGMEPTASVSRVRALRPGTIQTDVQYRFVTGDALGLRRSGDGLR
jgi:protein-tyrosine phosphatase